MDTPATPTSTFLSSVLEEQAFETPLTRGATKDSGDIFAKAFFDYIKSVHNGKPKPFNDCETKYQERCSQVQTPTTSTDFTVGNKSTAARSASFTQEVYTPWSESLLNSLGGSRQSVYGNAETIPRKQEDDVENLALFLRGIEDRFERGRRITQTQVK